MPDRPLPHPTRRSLLAQLATLSALATAFVWAPSLGAQRPVPDRAAFFVTASHADSARGRPRGVAAAADSLSALYEPPPLAVGAARDGRPSFARYAATGLLLGTVVGLGVGIYWDSQDCDDCMIPATPFTTAAGAAAGLVGGTIVWGIRRLASAGPGAAR